MCEGMNEIIHGDSLELEWESILGGRKIDLLMIDPPYNTTKLEFDGNFSLTTLMKHMHRFLSPTVWIFVWGPLEMAIEMLPTYRRKFEYVWRKQRGTVKTYNTIRPYNNHEICWVFVHKDLVRMTSLYFDKKQLRTVAEPYIDKRHHKRDFTEFWQDEFISRATQSDVKLGIP